MLSTIGFWLIAVPLEQPWRAIILIGEVLVLAFAMSCLWGLAFSVKARAGRVLQATLKPVLPGLRDVSTVGEADKTV